MPSSTATLLTKPLKKRRRARITSSTKSATPKPSSCPKDGLGKAPFAPSTILVSVGRPPPAQLIPTRINETPITRMIVPVTTGGNSGKSLPMKGATSTAKTPAAMTEP